MNRSQWRVVNQDIDMAFPLSIMPCTRAHLQVTGHGGRGTKSSVSWSNNNNETLTLSELFLLFDLERMHVSTCSDIRKVIKIMQKIKGVKG